MRHGQGPSTRSVHLALQVDAATRAIAPPIVENSAFAFPDLETWRAVALHREPGDIYSRNSKSTTRLFEERVAALEGAESATSFATGMAAITTTLLALLSPSQRVVTVRDAYGATFLLLRSLKTLGLRVQRQNQNALALARFLEQHPKVVRVHYPGLESHPGHDTAIRQMSGFGGVLSFELRGGMEAVARLLPRLRYAYLAPNLGQVETVVGPPALTSHVELSEEERARAGVPEGLIRYAVGIEDLEDLKADLEGALASL